MPDFDGPASFLAALADARITGEYRPHAPRYPRRARALGSSLRFDPYRPIRFASRSRW